MTNPQPEFHMDESFIRIPVDGVTLEGDLIVPPGALGCVLFAHGSGSSRLSPRNVFVSQILQDGNLATLLVDLLTPSEEQVDIHTRHLRFDISLLARRLVGITDWLVQQPRLRGMKIGYFGASTGAAAALVAAALHPRHVAAVVSRGGRPDLAGNALPRVKAPTLLIVGGNDTVVLDLNRQVLGELQPEHRLEIIPGATHLFEEPGALTEVGRMARQWFEAQFVAAVIEG